MSKLSNHGYKFTAFKLTTTNSMSLLLPLPIKDPSSPRASPAHSPRENGIDKTRILKKDASSSPASTASSGSSASMKSKEMGLVSILNCIIF